MQNNAVQIEKTRIDLLVLTGNYDSAMEQRYNVVSELEQKAKGLSAEIDAAQKRLDRLYETEAAELKIFDAMLKVEPYLRDLHQENGGDPTVGLFPDPELNTAFEQFTEALNVAREKYGK